MASDSNIASCRTEPVRVPSFQDHDSVGRLEELLAELPEALSRQVFTHASWSEHPSDSYARLAFLGDSVLSLAIATHIFPRLGALRVGPGGLTKVRAQTVSGASCRKVAERLGVPERLRSAAPARGASVGPEALATERVLASVIEAVIGACYLQVGYERTATAVVEAFAPEVEEALKHPLDFKSALQEMLASRGQEVRYQVTGERGPPHDRIFEVAAIVNDVALGAGSGRSKKQAEQEAACEALEKLKATCT